MIRIAAACCFMISAFIVQAAAEEVPFKVQAAIITKMLAFENNWEKGPGKDTLNIGIAYRGDEKSRAGAKAMAVELAKLRSLGVTIKNCPFECFSAEITGRDRLVQWIKDKEISVLYVLGAKNAVPQITEATQATRVLSVAGDDAEIAVRRGIAVGLTEEDSRPVILVNLASVMKEGKDFSTQFLSLAKMVK